MINAPLPRIDIDEELRTLLLPYCRLKEGEVWKDPMKANIKLHVLMQQMVRLIF